MHTHRFVTSIALSLVTATAARADTELPVDLDDPFLDDIDREPEDGADATGRVASTSELRWVWGPGAGTPVAGSRQRTVATQRGARTVVTTHGLTPGHAYTLWFAFFNHPENCLDSSQPGFRCGPADMVNPAAGLAVVYGDGLVATGSGDRFDARVRTGEAPTGDEQIAMGDGKLTNPLGAEYQCIVRNHGPADPRYPEQQTSMHGGCHPGEPYQCSDDQAAGARAGLPLP